MLENELLNRSKKELVNRFSLNIFSLEIFRPYFIINYEIIKNQILLLLYPFQPESYQELQLNLYIPLMSIITIFLFLHKEIKKASLAFSKTLIVSFLSILAFKLFFYLHSVRFSFMDLICYTSYKFFFALFMQRWSHAKIIWNLLILINYFYFITRSFKQKLFYQSNVDNLKYLLLGIGTGDVFVLVIISLIV